MNYDFNIILIGAGDSSVEVVDYLLNDKNFNTKLFSISIYDDNFKNKKFFKKLSIRIKLNKIKKLKFTKAKNTKYLITFGNTKLRKKKQKINIADVSKKLGAMWGTLDDKAKAPYTKSAEKDRNRYKDEMEQYNA